MNDFTRSRYDFYNFKKKILKNLKHLISEYLNHTF